MKSKFNLSIDEKVKSDFITISEKLGVKPSPWVEQQMKEFIRINKKLLKNTKERK